MNAFRSSARALSAAALAAGAICPALAQQAPPPSFDEMVAKVAAALPAQPAVKPRQARTLLVFSATRGFRHSSIPIGVHAMKALGEKTGAFTAVASEDIQVFEPESLRQFDAVLMLNTTGELFRPIDYKDLPEAARKQVDATDARLRKSLLDFVNGGKGLAGIHAATDCFYEWPEYGEMIGGYFDGHPWHEKVTLRVNDRKHPVCRCFEDETFEIVDEIYQLRDPWSRQRQRVLLTLDTSATNMLKEGIRRKDGDFGVTWVRTQGKGRVFYCSLGHREEIYWNPLVLRHYLAGIQFALGDLEADTKPIPAAPPARGALPGEGG